MSQPTQPTIKMTFEPGKPVVVEVQGVKGQDCRAFSKPIEDALGGEVVSDTPTGELYEAPATAAVQNEQKAGLG